MSRLHKKHKVAVDPRGSLLQLLRGRLRSNPCAREPHITQASVSALWYHHAAALTLYRCETPLPASSRRACTRAVDSQA